MKNKLANIGVRIGAYIAGIMSVVLIAVGALGMVATYQMSLDGDVLTRGYEIIAENYGAYILDTYFTDPDEVEETLAETNLYYTIIESIPIVDGYRVFDDVSTHVYSNMPSVEMNNDHLATLEGQKESFYYYDISNIYEAFHGAYVRLIDYDTQKYAGIQNIILDETEGMFYLKTEHGYFLLDQIFIVPTDDSDVWHYSRIEEEGKSYYYENDYGDILDARKWKTWSAIAFGSTFYEVEDMDMFQVVDDNTEILENLLTFEYSIHGGTTVFYEYIEDGMELGPVYTVVMTLDPAMEKDDLFKEWNEIITPVYEMKETFPVFVALGVLLFIISMGLIIYTANADKEKLKFSHKCPLFIYLCVMGAVEIGLALIIVGVLHLVLENGYEMSLNTLSSICQGTLAAMAFIFFRLVSNLATRIKTRTLYRYSELYYIIKPIKSIWRTIKNKLAELRKLISENVPLFWKVSIGVAAVDFVEYFTLRYYTYNYVYYSQDEFYMLFAIYKLIQYVAIVYLAMQMSQLQKGAKRIAEGDLTPIDTGKMFGDLKTHGENINRVGDGIAKAVEERLKSERLKTELITNVSHDIKTPLTSIINYVDLIKKENVTDATLLEYVDVLDRQSARLKKLIEDLMEASKASTGNLKVELEDCDISMLIGQVAGEFEDRFAINGLETIIIKPEEPVYIQADGRHIWRVLDNLMNNINKYSLPNSRVYIQLQQNGDKAVLQFKNISKSQLNISSDELMERFVRGDSSRNTEGSGLGLSIAQSLTELMQGSMTLDIDGDLFKVTLTFPVYRKPLVITE